MSRVLISGGRVVDPASQTDRVKDVKIEDGVIVKDFKKTTGVITIDAKGLIVTPGLIDMHVHLREPGREDEETIESGAKAAAAGGFTTLACMPNTKPPIDNRSVLEYVIERAAGASANVKVVAAISVGLAGECLSEMGDLADGGAVGFSDDGRPVTDSGLMRRAMEYSKVFNLPIISHAEDMYLSNNGVMHEGFISTQLGLKGIPAGAEETMVARDIVLAELTGARLHITHVSTAGSVAMVRAAKQRGLRVTADVTPHHLVLTDENLKGYDTNYKVNPPLRTQADNEALMDGLIDGTIDAIASDHAPHAAQEKDQEIERAPFGAIGLQTTVAVLLTHIVDSRLEVRPKTGRAGQNWRTRPKASDARLTKPEVRERMCDYVTESRARKTPQTEFSAALLDLACLIGKLTTGPAKILGLSSGTLAPGAPADVAVIDPKAKLKVEPDYFVSTSRNSAFIGSDLVGRVKHTILGGRFVYKDGGLVK